MKPPRFIEEFLLVLVMSWVSGLYLDQVERQAKPAMFHVVVASGGIVYQDYWTTNPPRPYKAIQHRDEYFSKVLRDNIERNFQ